MLIKSSGIARFPLKGSHSSMLELVQAVLTRVSPNNIILTVSLHLLVTFSQKAASLSRNTQLIWPALLWKRQSTYDNATYQLLF